MAEGALVIACGALAHELVELQRRNQWQLKIQCLPADLHNRPKEIPDAVEDLIVRYQDEYRNIYIGYADCGTGGLLDKVIDKYDVERIPGAHCYEFFAGAEVFADLAEEELGTLYLTDYLVKYFDHLIVDGFGIGEHPELRDMYFGNYRRVVYLAQTDNEELSAKARECAEFLDLAFEEKRTGLKPLENLMQEHAVHWR